MSAFVDNVIFEELSKIDGVDFCVVTGSYAGNEAAWIENDGSNPQVYNDIDLLIVTEQKQELAQCLEMARKNISKRLNLQWVDFLIWDNRDLIKVRRTIFYYDLCRRHQVLIGDSKKFVSKLHFFDQGRIRLFDIKALFRTRAWAVLSLFASQGAIKNDKTFRSYQCAKAIFAITDFLCLSNGCYKTDYKEKMEAVKQLPDTEESIFVKQTVDLAYKVKIRPNSCALASVADSSEMLAKLSVYYVQSGEYLLKRNIFSTFSNYVIHKFLSYAAALFRVVLVRSFEPLFIFHNRARIEAELIKIAKNPFELMEDAGFIRSATALISRKV